MPGTICKVSVGARVLFPKQLIVSIREIRVLAGRCDQWFTPGSPGCKDDSSKSSLGCENVFLLCVLFAPLPKSFGVPKSFNPSIMCNDCKVLPSRNDKGLLHLCINIFLFRPNSGLISIDCYHYWDYQTALSAIPGITGGTGQPKYGLQERVQHLEGEKYVDRGCE